MAAPDLRPVLAAGVLEPIGSGSESDNATRGDLGNMRGRDHLMQTHLALTNTERLLRTLPDLMSIPELSRLRRWRLRWLLERRWKSALRELRVAQDPEAIAATDVRVREQGMRVAMALSAIEMNVSGIVRRAIRLSSGDPDYLPSQEVSKALEDVAEVRSWIHRENSGT